MKRRQDTRRVDKQQKKVWIEKDARRGEDEGHGGGKVVILT